MRKRLCCLLLAALLAVGLLPMGALADGAALSLAGPETVKPGETFRVTASITGNPGISGYDLALAYDHAALTLVGAAAAADLGYFAPGEGDTITGKITAVGSGVYTADGALFTLTFAVADAAADGVYSIGCEGLDFSVYDADDADEPEKAVAVSASPLSVTVKKAAEPSYVLGDVDGDGVADAWDATLIMMFEIGMLSDEEIAEEGYSFDHCDVNEDGFIDAWDATQIMMLEIGMISEYEKDA